MKRILNKQEVNDYIRKGHTLKETAYHFNVKYNSVARFCRENNIRLHKTINEDDLIKLKNIAKSKTVPELANIFQITQSNVRYYLNKYNINYKHVYIKNDEYTLKSMVIYLSKAFSPTAIIEQLKLPQDFVYNTIQEYSSEIHNRKRK